MARSASARTTIPRRTEPAVPGAGRVDACSWKGRRSYRGARPRKAARAELAAQRLRRTIRAVGPEAWAGPWETRAAWAARAFRTEALPTAAPGEATGRAAAGAAGPAAT